MSFCSDCGAFEEQGAAFCQKCGGSLAVAPPAPTKTSGAAIASLVFGILVFFPLAPIFAVVLGHLARYRIKRSHGTLTGDGAALGGLVLGYFFICCGFLALPMFFAEQAHEKEHLALVSANRTRDALAAYHERTGDYPESLAQLGQSPGDCGDDGQNDACRAIAADLLPHKGYTFTYTRLSSDEFKLVIRATKRGTYNKRSFLIDETGDMRVTEEDREPTRADYKD